MKQIRSNFTTTTHELAVKITNTTKFTGHDGDDWETWIRRLEARFQGVNDSKWVAILRDVIDGAALGVYGQL